MDTTITIHEITSSYRTQSMRRSRIDSVTIYATVEVARGTAHTTPTVRSEREAAEIAEAWLDSPEALHYAEEEAWLNAPGARTYDQAALRLHGGFAKINGM